MLQLKNKRSIVKALEQKSIADGISIIPIPLEHQEITGEMVENYGYIIDIQNEFRVLYFTDMKSIDFNLRPYKADLIIVEANYERRVIQFAIKNQSMSEFQIMHYRRVLHSHMSVQRTAKWLGTQDLTNTKMIILMHLTTNYQNRNSGKYKEIVINELKRSGKKHIPKNYGSKNEWRFRIAMSFELKNTDVLVGYNDTTNEYTFNLSGVKRKKIASRRLPVLLNMNKFSSVGKGLLEINGLIKPDPFDSWYTIRGAIAEHFAQHELRRYIRDTKGVEITKLLAFNPREANYDQFKYNEFFGGVIDIAIQEPQSLRAVAEVKSKSLEKMSYITEDNIPQEELYQGFLLAYLSKSPTLYMFTFSSMKNKKLKLRN